MTDATDTKHLVANYPSCHTLHIMSHTTHHVNPTTHHANQTTGNTHQHDYG